MLKKAGIVVAAATAGLLAVSPLAFATGSNDNSENHTQGGGLVSLVNVQDVTAQVPIQACNNNVNVIGVSDITAALGLLAPGTATSDDSCSQGNSATDGPAQG